MKKCNYYIFIIRCDQENEWTVLRLDEKIYTQDPLDIGFESFEFNYISKLSEIAQLLTIPTIQQYHEKLGILSPLTR